MAQRSVNRRWLIPIEEETETLEEFLKQGKRQKGCVSLITLRETSRTMRGFVYIGEKETRLSHVFELKLPFHPCDFSGGVPVSLVTVTTYS